jgi:hypothetical protein
MVWLKSTFNLSTKFTFIFEVQIWDLNLKLKWEKKTENKNKRKMRKAYLGLGPSLPAHWLNPHATQFPSTARGHSLPGGSWPSSASTAISRDLHRLVISLARFSLRGRNPPERAGAAASEIRAGFATTSSAAVARPLFHITGPPSPLLPLTVERLQRTDGEGERIRRHDPSTAPPLAHSCSCCRRRGALLATITVLPAPLLCPWLPLPRERKRNRVSRQWCWAFGYCRALQVPLGCSQGPGSLAQGSDWLQETSSMLQLLIVVRHHGGSISQRGPAPPGR